jgi:tellurite resistance protein TerC
MDDFGIINYGIFFAIVIIAIAIDLGIHKESRAVSIRVAVFWSIFWILVSLAFGVYIFLAFGADSASRYLTGYILEKSLAVDNLFVFIAIFSSFSIADKYQHKILYYGILGAIIFRIILISAGTAILQLGEWVMIVFAVIIIYSAYKLYKETTRPSEEIEDYTNHWAVVWVKKLLPVYPRLAGNKFFVRKEDLPEGVVLEKDARFYVTPLFLALICIEVADIMFAFDSIPAVIAVTQNFFLILTSNIFAILGLRSLYFVLSYAKKLLCHLDKAIILLLVYIGIKIMLNATHIIHIGATVSLIITFVILTGGVVASFIYPCRVNNDSK